MAETVSELKIGDRLLLGRYSADPNNANPPRITWLKATANCDFISEFAIDRLIYDAYERERDNEDYMRSNIRQYLNAEGEDWFVPADEYDKAPVGQYYWQNEGMYGRHSGFLTHFDEYELEALIDTGAGLIGLPTIDQVFHGDQQFKLFHRKGIRAKFTWDCWARWYSFMERDGFTEGSYIETMTRDGARGSLVRYVDRSGLVHRKSTGSLFGVRPVCLVNPSTHISLVSPGVYEVAPSSTSSSMFSRAALEELFGLV